MADRDIILDAAPVPTVGLGVEAPDPYVVTDLPDARDKSVPQLQREHVELAAKVARLEASKKKRRDETEQEALERVFREAQYNRIGGAEHLSKAVKDAHLATIPNSGVEDSPANMALRLAMPNVKPFPYLADQSIEARRERLNERANEYEKYLDEMLGDPVKAFKVAVDTAWGDVDARDTTSPMGALLGEPFDPTMDPDSTALAEVARDVLAAPYGEDSPSVAGDLARYAWGLAKIPTFMASAEQLKTLKDHPRLDEAVREIESGLKPVPWRDIETVAAENIGLPQDDAPFLVPRAAMATYNWLATSTPVASGVVAAQAGAGLALAAAMTKAGRSAAESPVEAVRPYGRAMEKVGRTRADATKKIAAEQNRLIAAGSRREGWTQVEGEVEGANDLGDIDLSRLRLSDLPDSAWLQQPTLQAVLTAARADGDSAPERSKALLEQYERATGMDPIDVAGGHKRSPADVERIERELWQHFEATAGLDDLPGAVRGGAVSLDSLKRGAKQSRQDWIDTGGAAADYFEKSLGGLSMTGEEETTFGWLMRVPAQLVPGLVEESSVVPGSPAFYDRMMGLAKEDSAKGSFARTMLFMFGGAGVPFTDEEADQAGMTGLPGWLFSAEETAAAMAQYDTRRDFDGPTAYLGRWLAGMDMGEGGFAEGYKEVMHEAGLPEDDPRYKVIRTGAHMIDLLLPSEDVAVRGATVTMAKASGGYRGGAALSGFGPRGALGAMAMAAPGVTTRILDAGEKGPAKALAGLPFMGRDSGFRDPLTAMNRATAALVRGAPARGIDPVQVVPKSWRGAMVDRVRLVTGLDEIPARELLNQYGQLVVETRKQHMNNWREAAKQTDPDTTAMRQSAPYQAHLRALDSLRLGGLLDESSLQMMLALEETVARRRRVNGDIAELEDHFAEVGLSANPKWAPVGAGPRALAEFRLEHIERVEAMFRAETDKVGLADVDLRLSDMLDEGRAGGVYHSGRRLIEIAMDQGLGLARQQLNHEIIHALRDRGVLRMGEWEALAQRAVKWLDDDRLRVDRTGKRASKEDGGHTVRERYTGELKSRIQAGMDPARARDILLEEAVAEAYRVWREGDLKASGAIGRALERIKQFFEALANALRGNGFTSAEGVLRAIERGEMGTRTVDGPELGQADWDAPLYARKAKGAQRHPADTGLKQVGPIHWSMPLAEVERALFDHAGEAEHGVAFGGDGRQLGRSASLRDAWDTMAPSDQALFERQGWTKEHPRAHLVVPVMPALRDAIIADGNGIYTHYHPSGSILSKEDVLMAVFTNAKEMRAVGKHGVYLLRRPTDGWGELFWDGRGMRPEPHVLLGMAMSAGESKGTAKASRLMDVEVMKAGGSVLDGPSAKGYSQEKWNQFTREEMFNAYNEAFESYGFRFRFEREDLAPVERGRPDVAVAVGRDAGAGLRADPEEAAVASIEVEEIGGASGGPIFSRRAAPKSPFYSAVERAIPVAFGTAKKMKAGSFIAAVKKQPNVKQTELDWMGLEAWATGKGTVTPEDVRAFVEQNRVVVEEQTLGHNPKIDRMAREWRAVWSEAADLIDEIPERAALKAAAVDAQRELDASMRAPVVVHNRARIAYDRAADALMEYDGRFHAAATETDFVALFPPEASDRAAVIAGKLFALKSEYRAEDVEPGRMTGKSAEYAAHVLPGGRNYREVLLRLPVERVGPRKKAAKQAAEAFQREMAAKYGEDPDLLFSGFERLNERNAAWGRLRGAMTAEERGTEGRLLEPVQRYFSMWDTSSIGDVYRGGHFGSEGENLVAHLRVNDRVGQNGERLLHVEEVQSDWAADVRKKGVLIDEVTAGLPDEVMPDTLTVTETEYQWVVTHPDGREVKVGKGTVDRYEAPAYGARVLNRARLDMQREIAAKNTVRVPPTPFPEDWHELAMKKALALAVEDGYDGLTWTTGKMQQERYDLRKQVDEIQYEYSKSGGTYTIYARKGGVQQRLISGVKPADLPDVVSKDVAKRIEDGAGQLLDNEYERSGILSGVDLAIGGAWTEHLYDRMLPGFLKRYAKSWGAKPGRTNFQDDQVAGMLGNTYDTTTTPTTGRIHHLPVTDKMRASVAEGQPLFSRRAPTFYSGLRRAVETLKQDQMSPEQMMGALRKAPGVKADEVKWTRLEDFLKGKRSVTKAEVVAWLNRNKVTLDEVLLGAPNNSLMEPDGPPVHGGGEFVLPGGQDYRELLFQLPNRAEWNYTPTKASQHFPDYAQNLMAHVRFNERTGPNGERILHIEEVQSDWHQEGRDEGYRGVLRPEYEKRIREKAATTDQERQKVRDDRLAAVDEYVAADEAVQTYTLANPRPTKPSTPPGGPEWDAWAHATGAWAEAGAEFFDRKREAITNVAKHYNMPLHQGGGAPGVPEGLYYRGELWTPDKLRDTAAARYDFGSAVAGDRLHRELYDAMESGPPPTPFAKTWHEMVLKRMFRWAAENDFDAITWTTGVQQVKRFEDHVRMAVDEIRWRKVAPKEERARAIRAAEAEVDRAHAELRRTRAPETPDADARAASQALRAANERLTDARVEANVDGDIVIEAVKNDNVVYNDAKPTHKLKDVIGGHMVKAIQESPETSGTLKGADLTIGGEGMKGFYDQMLPQWVNKYVAPWGARVERGEIGLTVDRPTDTWSVFEQRTGRELGRFKTEQEAVEFLAAKDEEGVTGLDWSQTERFEDPVHMLRITPEMRRVVLERGQPLFSRRAFQGLDFGRAPAYREPGLYDEAVTDHHRAVASAPGEMGGMPSATVTELTTLAYRRGPIRGETPSESTTPLPDFMFDDEQTLGDTDVVYRGGDTVNERTRGRLFSRRAQHDAQLDTRLPGLDHTRPMEGGVVDIKVALGDPEYTAKLAAALVSTARQQPIVITDKMDSKQREAQSKKVTGYEGIRPPQGRGSKAPEAQLEAFIEHGVDNIRWLYNQVPEDIRQRSRLWYDGANHLSVAWAERYGLTPAQVAGVLAALSPQRDWYQNVSLAERVLDVAIFGKDTAWTPEMATWMDNTTISSNVKGAPKQTFSERYPMVAEAVRGKTFGEVADPKARALWVRAFDATRNNSAYVILYPEGELNGPMLTKRGAPTNIGWGGLSEVARALEIVRDASPENISLNIGAAHKVRNFYNNILAPNSTRGEVTIDTHAVAAALLQPLAGSDPAVKTNFGTPSNKALGLYGSYVVYTEIYRRFAAEVGLRPREVQLITWEAIRGLFPDTYKNPENKVLVAEKWRTFGRGRVDLDATRNDILTAAGGIEPPTWFGRRGGMDAGEIGASSYKGELAGRRVPGRHPGPVDSGTRVDGPRGSAGLGSGRVDEPVYSRRAPDAGAPLAHTRAGRVTGVFYGAGGTTPPRQATTAKYLVALFKGADVRTLFHEYGHLMAELVGTDGRAELARYFDTLPRAAVVEIKRRVAQGDDHAVIAEDLGLWHRWTDSASLERQDPDTLVVANAARAPDGDPVPSRLGMEQGADAFRRYLELRFMPRGDLGRLLAAAVEGLRSLWSDFRGAARDLPVPVRDYWDRALRPDMVAKNRAVDVAHYQGLRETPTVVISPDRGEAVKKQTVRLEGMKREGGRITSRREEVLQSMGLRPGQKVGLDDLVARVIADVATERMRTGLMGQSLQAITRRTMVPASRVAAINQMAVKRFVDAFGVAPKDLVKQREGEGVRLTVGQQATLRVAAAELELEPMTTVNGRSLVPDKLLDPHSDLSIVSMDEINAIQELAIDASAGVGARRTRRAVDTASESAVTAMVGVLDRAIDRTSSQSLMAGVDTSKVLRPTILVMRRFQSWFSETFQVQRVGHGYIDPQWQELFERHARRLGTAQDWVQTQVAMQLRARPLRERWGITAQPDAIKATLQGVAKQLTAPVRDKGTRAGMASVDMLMALLNKYDSGNNVEDLLVPTEPARILQALEAWDHGISAIERGALVVLSRYSGQNWATLKAQERVEIEDALNHLLGGLNERTDLVAARGGEIMLILAGSEDANVLKTMPLEDKVDVYKAFYEGRWMESDVDQGLPVGTGPSTLQLNAALRGLLTGSEKKPGRIDIDYNIVFLEAVTRLRAHEILNEMFDEMVGLGLVGRPLEVDDSRFRANVVHYLNAICSWDEVNIITAGDKVVRLGSGPPPHGGDPLPSEAPDQPAGPIGSTRIHDPWAYLAAHEILDRWGFKYGKGEWTEMPINGRLEAVPAMAVEAIENALKEASTIGTAFGSARIDTSSTRLSGDKVGRLVARAIGSVPGMLARIKMGIVTGILVPNGDTFVGNAIGAHLQWYQALGLRSLVRSYGNPNQWRLVAGVTARVYGGGHAHGAGRGVASGATLGAAVGTAMGPGVGTAIGAAAGGAVGAATSRLGRKAPGKGGVLVTPSGRIYTADMLADMYVEHGLNSSFVKAESSRALVDDIAREHRTGLGNVLVPLEWWQDQIVNVYTSIDNWARVQVFLDRLRQGDSPDAAAAQARLAEYDYGRLTDREKSWLRTFSMFYAFERQNQTLFWWTMAHHPSRIMGQLRLSRDLQQEVEEQGGVLPEYAEGRWAFAYEAIVDANEAHQRGIQVRPDQTRQAGWVWISKPLSGADGFRLWADIADVAMSPTNADTWGPLVGRVPPWFMLPYVARTHQDMRFGGDLRYRNRVPMWFVEADWAMTGGTMNLVLGIEPDIESDFGVRESSTGPVNYRARNEFAWWTFQSMGSLVPGGGRSLNTIAMFDRAADRGPVEGMVRVMHDAREAAGFESMRAPEDVPETLASPRPGLTHAGEAAAIVGFRGTPVDTRTRHYERSLKEEAARLRGRYQESEDFNE